MPSEKSTVLIIDDEQVVCDVLRDELSERGYLCTTALDGSEALAKLLTQDFDVVLLDIRLPSMSGMEVLAKIRSSHPSAATVMITAVNDVDTVVQAMRLGALDYIVKPFNLERVNTSIRTVLETKKRLSQRRDYEILTYVGDEGEDKPAMEKCFGELNAIAGGVEARHDLLLGRSKIVAQETIDIARQLGIPEKIIQRWATTRSRHDTERNAAIKSSLNKLERSALAQSMMGMLVPYLCRPKLDEPEN